MTLGTLPNTHHVYLHVGTAYQCSRFAAFLNSHSSASAPPSLTVQQHTTLSEDWVSSCLPERAIDSLRNAAPEPHTCTLAPACSVEVDTVVTCQQSPDAV